MPTFNEQFDIAIDSMRETTNLEIRKIALDLLARIINISPVDTGRFRGNWTVSIGAPDASPPTDIPDREGGRTLSHGARVIDGYADAEGYPSIIIQNNLPYARALEFGHSAMASNGIVRLAAQELRR